MNRSSARGCSRRLGALRRLGKAGYWSGDESEPMSFRPIVGWVTCTTRGGNNFHPVVLADDMWPVVADFIESYRGAFLKELSPDEAKEKVREWRKSRREQQTDDSALSH